MSDDELDLELEDDPFFEEYKRKRMSEISKPISKQAVEYVLPKQALHDIVQIFKKMPDTQNCILDYVKSGSEINSALRENRAGEYKQKISCLDKKAVPLEQFLDNKHKSDYVTLYRAISTEYTNEKNSGFLSTSNLLIRGFGQYCMKIYVSIKTKVLVADISKHVNREGIYEIILPRNTRLIFIGEKDNCSYYLAIPPDTDEDGLEHIKNSIRIDLGKK